MSLPVIDNYVCNTCKRVIAIENNPTGITTLRRCIITQNCKGTLAKLVSSATNTIPIDVPGMLNWSQRNALFTYTQTIPAHKWIVKHNMGVVPTVLVYINDTSNNLVPTSDYVLTILSPFIIQITFIRQQTGTVQCIISSSNPVKAIPITIQQPSITQVSNNGILTIAIINNILPITSTLIFTNPTTGISNDVNFVYNTELNIDSPWHDYANVIIFGRIYNLYTIDINDISITTGSNITINDINGLTYSSDNVYVLMASPPYSFDDKISSSAIPLNAADSQLVCTNDEIYVYNNFIVPVYPYIIESSYNVTNALLPNNSAIIERTKQYIGYAISNVDELMQLQEEYPYNWTLTSFIQNTGFLGVQLSTSDLDQIITNNVFNINLLNTINGAINNQLKVYNIVGDPSWLNTQNAKYVQQQITQMSNLPFQYLMLDSDPLNGSGTLTDNLNQWLQLITIVNQVNILPLWVILDYTIIAPGWINTIQAMGVVGIVVRFYTTDTVKQIQLISTILTLLPQLHVILEVSIQPTLPPSQSYASYSLQYMDQQLTQINNALNLQGFEGIMINSWNDYYLIANPI